MTAAIDYEALYRDVLPSVVSIYRTPGRSRHPGGSGSGFVYDEAGHLLTNRHVVDGFDEVDVRFADGSWRTGRVVGEDAYTDLAVVRVADLPADARPLPVAGTNPTPGRPVAALGNPFGLDGSISAGIVSGANRSMGAEGRFAIPDVVQTDAPINPGNSGGPLVAVADDASDDAEVDGAAGGPRYEVVGVNRAKSGDNVGFAVSPEIVSRVVPTLVETGRYRHSFLRVRTIDVTPTVAEANGLDEPAGVLVVDVDPSLDGALRSCHRQRRVRGRTIPVGGDVIVGLDGRELRSHEELVRRLIGETRPGDEVELSVVREGRPATVAITLGERPEPGRSVAVG